MIELIRKSGPFKILEKRYISKIENNKKYDLVKLYSFKDLGTPSIKTVAMCIDLKKDKEILFNGFNKNYKKHIRREERENIKVTISKDYKKFYNKIYNLLTKEKNLRKFPLDYIKQGDLWIAKKEDKWLAAQIIFHDKEYATQSFNVGTKTEYNGNRLITWKALQHYKEMGLKHFNFGGGNSDYKRRFGAEEKEVFIYELINNRMYKVIRRIYQRIRK